MVKMVGKVYLISMYVLTSYLLQTVKIKFVYLGVQISHILFCIFVRLFLFIFPGVNELKQRVKLICFFILLIDFEYSIVKDSTVRVIF